MTKYTKMAVPEAHIGFLPDVGVTHLLSVTSPELKLHVGLTSMALAGTDALHCHPTDVCALAE